MPFVKGQSGNKKGRPRHSLNRNNPQRKLQMALANGYDLKDLKVLIIEMLKDKELKLTPKERTDILRMALDTEYKLLKLAFDEELGEGECKDKEGSSEEESDSEEAIFSLKAV